MAGDEWLWEPKSFALVSRPRSMYYSRYDMGPTILVARIQLLELRDDNSGIRKRCFESRGPRGRVCPVVS